MKNPPDLSFTSTKLHKKLIFDTNKYGLCDLILFYFTPNRNYNHETVVLGSEPTNIYIC